MPHTEPLITAQDCKQLYTQLEVLRDVLSYFSSNAVAMTSISGCLANSDEFIQFAQQNLTGHQTLLKRFEDTFTIGCECDFSLSGDVDVNLHNVTVALQTLPADKPAQPILKGSEVFQQKLHFKAHPTQVGVSKIQELIKNEPGYFSSGGSSLSRLIAKAWHKTITDIETPADETQLVALLFKVLNNTRHPPTLVELKAKLIEQIAQTPTEYIKLMQQHLGVDLDIDNIQTTIEALRSIVSSFDKTLSVVTSELKTLEQEKAQSFGAPSNRNPRDMSSKHLRAVQDRNQYEKKLQAKHKELQDNPEIRDLRNKLLQLEHYQRLLVLKSDPSARKHSTSARASLTFGESSRTNGLSPRLTGTSTSDRLSSSSEIEVGVYAKQVGVYEDEPVYKDDPALMRQFAQNKQVMNISLNHAFQLWSLVQATPTTANYSLTTATKFAVSKGKTVKLETLPQPQIQAMLVPLPPATGKEPIPPLIPHKPATPKSKSSFGNAIKRLFSSS